MPGLLTLLGRRGMPGYGEVVRRTAPGSLVAHWPLSDASGTIARDASGNGRHAAYKGAGEPLLGQAGIGDGQTAPLFDGTNDFVNVYSAGLAGAWSGDEVTYLAWAKVQDAAVWTDAATRRIAHMQADANNQLSIFRNGVNNQLRLQMTIAGVQKNRIETVAPSTGWMSLLLRRSKAGVPSGPTMICYLNGQQLGLDIPTTEAWAGVLASANCVIGALSTGGTQAWRGSLAHHAVWSAALTIGDIAAVTRTGGIVAYEGDSLTVGVGGATPYPVQLSYTAPGLSGWNAGIGGTTVQQMVDRFAANVASLRTSRVERNVAVLLGGTNDAATGVSGATIWSRLQTWHAAARAAGFRTVACTIPPRGDTFNTAVGDANTLIRANWSGAADGLADLQADARLQDPNNTTYFNADKIHLTTAGNGVVAGIVKTAVEAL